MINADRYPPTDVLARFLADALTPPTEGTTDRRKAIPTGFRPLDAALGGGLRRGQLTLVAGVPGVGTSTFALDIAREATIRQNIRTALVAPDSSHTELLSRLVAAETSTNVAHIRTGMLSTDERQRLSRHRERLAHARLWINAEYPRALPAETLLDTVRYMTDFDEHGLVLIDGTSHVEPDTRALALGLRSLAQERQVAILVTTKTLTPADRRTAPPLLEDLREYAMVADLFDLVLMIHRGVPTGPSGATDQATVSIVKHRYGPHDTVSLSFQGHFGRFADVEQNEDER